jgi:SAM-dependent methyltransferase
VSFERNLERSDRQRTADHWSAEGAWQSGRGLFWLELPAVQRRLNTKVSGRPEVDWVRHTLEHHLSGKLPLGRCLSLGCGEGGLERQLAALGVFAACDAFDLAPGSIAKARELAEQSGYETIQYTIQDANSMELPRQAYDAVWSSGATHHFEHLEHVFKQVAGGLGPGGLFVLNEYVGPSRFQFPPYQRQVIQACMDLLPLGYRRTAPAVLQERSSTQGSRNPAWLARRVVDKCRDGDLLAAVGRRLRMLRATVTGAPLEKASANLPTERSVIAVDPSEAVRSADIVPILQRSFEILEYKPLGGSILQFLLADIAGNFETDEGQRLLQMLFDIEDGLMATGDLSSDFAYIVATPLIEGQP